MSICKEFWLVFEEKRLVTGRKRVEKRFVNSFSLLLVCVFGEITKIKRKTFERSKIILYNSKEIKSNQISKIIFEIKNKFIKYFIFFI